MLTRRGIVRFLGDPSWAWGVASGCSGRGGGDGRVCRLLLRDHVTLTCRSVDRIFCRLTCRSCSRWAGCVVSVLAEGVFDPVVCEDRQVGDAYVAEVYRWAKANAIPVRRFARVRTRSRSPAALIDAAEREGGDGKVVLIGIAQETQTPMWRSWKAKGQEHAAHPHMEWGRQMGFVNHFYFYLWDSEWGGAFWKTNAYAPWPVWIWLNGHTWAQRQCDRLGIGYTALALTASASVRPHGVMQRICDRLGSGAVKSFFWRWHKRLPSPLTRRGCGCARRLRLRVAVSPVRDLRHRCSTGRRRGARFSSSSSGTTSTSGRAASRCRGLRSADHPYHPGQLAHPGHHQGGRSADQLLLQVQPDLTQSQGAAGVAHRDGHLRHPRLRYRPAGHRRELESPSGGWRCGQPASVRARKQPTPGPLRMWPPTPR